MSTGTSRHPICAARALRPGYVRLSTATVLPGVSCMVVIASNAILMIHNPYTYASGDAENLRKVAAVLDQATEVIIAAYKSKAPNIDEVELRRLVNAETWLTASEAVALGLADEVGEGVTVKACLGQGSALQRFQHAPQALLAQLEEPPEPAPEPTPEPIAPEPEKPPIADSAKLALLITQSCNTAGISNLIESLITSTKLADEATVNAALTNAKAVRDLCVAARLPEFTQEFVAAGLSAEAVRGRLFDKLVSGGGFEIDNSLPINDDPVPKIQAKQPDPPSIWAARQSAQSGQSKSAKGTRA